MEHRLVVATIGFMSRHRVRCDGEHIRVDGERLDRPLQLAGDELAGP
jgi:hypothetical protein